MHILDVISSISRSSKCTKIVGGCDFTPDPTRGAYSTPQTPKLGFQGPTSKVPTSKGSGGERREGERRAPKMIYSPWHQKPSRPTATDVIK